MRILQIFRMKLILSAVLMLLLLGLLVFSQENNQVFLILRAVVGSLCLLFLPGYRISYTVFKEEEIDILERIALSFAFSISVVPLLVFYINVMHIPIGPRLVYGVVVGVILGSVGYICYKQ